jgi:hypothetical protein
MRSDLLIVDRHLDEGRGRKIVVSMSTSEARAATCRSPLRPLGHLLCIAPGEFLDDEQQSGTFINDTVPDHRLMINHDLSNVLQQQRPAVPDCEGHWPVPPA